MLPEADRLRGEFHRAARRRDCDQGLMEHEAASALLRGETDRADAAAWQHLPHRVLITS